MSVKFIGYGKREISSPKGNGNAEKYFLRIYGFELALSTNPFLPEAYEKLKEAQ